MDLKERIEALVEGYLQGSEYFLVNVLIAGGKSVPKLIIWLDGDAGVSIDKCAEVSRWLGKRIEDENLIETNYTLEVSSPGIDQPLKLFRQYKQHLGRNLRVTLKDGSTKTGKLEEVKETSVTIAETAKGKKKENNPLLEIATTDIEKAFVLISFNL
ncbi:ribosome maturation factor RimP [Rhodocytophaga aerolata]|uniref:Ribosome maturation factor RimP n=1 Tax=Rhodocytophaga aerolata TaxID=455078 RepID=A0ABT8R4T2_9BACT|nr:ribosome maturation factor RimP [Rhodocytophaga aerolata]MDO1446303.1 ribosome maturation factor RimP [Rhodocytophaga aerolata]